MSRIYKKVLSTIGSFLVHQVEKNGARRHSFAVFITVNYLASLLIAPITGDFIDDSVTYMHLVSILLCIGLLFVEYWPGAFRINFYPLYWYFCLLFCIPCTVSYTILITHIDKFWLLNSLLSMILLFAISDWIGFASLIAIGGVLGYAIYVMMIAWNTSELNYFPSYDILLLFYLYCFLIWIMFLFVRDKERFQSKQLEYMEIFGGAIAHEVNTPIATIQMIAMTLTDVTSCVAESAIKVTAEDGGIDYALTVPETEFKMVFELLPYDLLKTAIETKKVIEVLLLLLKHRGNEYNGLYSVKEIVREVIEEYTIHDLAKRKRIHFKSNYDFKFFGTRQYIKQVLNNLLSNSFKYAGDEAQITIWMESNVIHFKDNGVGIEPRHIHNIFKPFHEKGVKGTGIGLAFCGILINNMGGSIECASELGKYTEFIISLPVTRHNGFNL